MVDRNKDFKVLMATARKTNLHRDLISKQCGLKAPRECGPGPYLTAAIDAVECGLMVREWDSVAEGLAMLEDLRTRYAIVLGSRK